MAKEALKNIIPDDFRPLNIVITNRELCANNTNVLTTYTKFLKYIEIWNRLESLFSRITSNNFKYNIECNIDYSISIQ